ncbi:hypothetical protein HMPREF1624_07477 [Sporothrix schenckii ATCC 58251]|uniref:Uncharacterized protein n=1 Tax=Sporothrix schenckii (strain ATCC 58251 / de Perez 2211183) TaxID=1391915 RepID=U7PK65_SPOS1|nr:hypothetical protein HMPREF1624_07477 [Sporothrix schenckii ATCC 58251]
MAVAPRNRFRTAAAIAVAAALGIGYTVRRNSNRLRENELVQQRARIGTATPVTATNPPNLYVSVDRSGGGI